ncbi:DUF3073 domain-containing protein [Corynebacterium macclintockiae]|uniref:DUF3073 domain-containing protein n=1 Tax=Corynebacterium macclintockiae TaxID=2913501 RepID=A0A9X3RTV7_9CORY|nr:MULTISPECIES: DUF3073 domain-containing protein [Corynebacterium]MCZ9305733.1 DUF3073 domain-containing protein [Corynebacterium macclintockiae]MDK8870800.1 DUF3073 domain-containing protein [Corynebacterium macclintockiae]
MGRGRAKAKQAKVARQLKYNAPEMDLESLQRELSGQSQNRGSGSRGDDSYDDYEDDYSEYAEAYDDYDDEYADNYEDGYSDDSRK